MIASPGQSRSQGDKGQNTELYGKQYGRKWNEKWENLGCSTSMIRSSDTIEPQRERNDPRMKWMFHFVPAPPPPQRHMCAPAAERCAAESAGEEIEAQQQVRKEAGRRNSFGSACQKLRGFAFSLSFFFPRPCSFTPHCAD